MFASENENRIFAGWITVEARDSQGELLPLTTILDNMPFYMDTLQAPINLNHSNWTVGRLLDYEQRFNDEAQAPGLFGRGTIFEGYPLHDDVWDAIQDGRLNQLSLAGQFEMNENGVAEWSGPMEISVTGPAVDSKAVNEACNITNVSKAKSKAFKKMFGRVVA
ncbi:MAG: hypothetical protein M0R66_01265 [Candidatus Omnitrophica bacterium]|nr:hypothetical protein [Candidatus Omnitrophota bacterium]